MKRTVPIRPDKAERAVRMLSRDPPMPWVWAYPVVIAIKAQNHHVEQGQGQASQEDRLPAVCLPSLTAHEEQPMHVLKAKVRPSGCDPWSL